jgi:hypothetical protein
MSSSFGANWESKWGSGILGESRVRSAVKGPKSIGSPEGELGIGSPSGESKVRNQKS